MRGIFVGTVAIFLAAVSTARAIDYISQLRSVDATAGAMAHKESTTLGFWSDTANVAEILTSLPPVTIAEGFADQSSNLSDQLISTSGSLSAFGAENYLGTGRSELTIEFSLDSAAPYVTTLSTTGETETSITASAGWNPTASGILTAGTYSLSVVFDIAASGGSASSGTYAYRLSLIPEPSSLCLLLGGLLMIAFVRPVYDNRPNNCQVEMVNISSVT